DRGSGWRERAGGERGDALGGGGTKRTVSPGYAYTREVSPVWGEPVTIYDSHRPETWHVPFRDQVSPALVVRAPLGGYVVPCAWAAEIGACLALHGIHFEVVVTASNGVRVVSFSATL